MANIYTNKMDMLKAYTTLSSRPGKVCRVCQPRPICAEHLAGRRGEDEHTKLSVVFDQDEGWSVGYRQAACVTSNHINPFKHP